MRTTITVIVSLLLCTPVFAGLDSDGVDDVVTVSHASSLDGGVGEILFISVWMKSSQTGTAKTILGKGDGFPSGGYYFRWDNGTAGKAEFCDDGACATSNSTVNDGAWHHFAMVADDDGTNELSLWVDGVKQTDSESAVDLPSNSDDFTFMRGPGEVGNPASDQVLSDLAVWKGVVLSSQEISSLASSKVKRTPLQIQPANLSLYMPMDDQPAGTSAHGDTVSDLSGNGNDGTGSYGANTTGLSWTAEEVLTYL